MGIMSRDIDSIIELLTELQKTQGNDDILITILIKLLKKSKQGSEK
jgi:hypothetical protein